MRSLTRALMLGTVVRMMEGEGAGAAAPTDPNGTPANNETAPPAAAPAPEPAKGQTEAPKISRLRLVILTIADALDGETEWGGIVTKVNDDGSVNVKGFAPNGGADTFFTGVRNKAEVEAMPDGADKNAARSTMWDWPPRV